MFEFPDISRPGIGHQRPESAAGEHQSRLSGHAFALLQKVHGQHRDILTMVAQSRGLDGDDFQPVIKIFPEFALGDQPPELRIGSRDQTHIHADVPIAAKGFDLAQRKSPQQTLLHFQGRGLNFIQKQRASVSLQECALPIFLAVGECASDMTEQSVQKKGFIELSAVDGNERLDRPLRETVHGFGRELFARSRLPFYQHVHVHLTGLDDVALHLLHISACPDEFGKHIVDDGRETILIQFRRFFQHHRFDLQVLRSDFLELGPDGSDQGVDGILDHLRLVTRFTQCHRLPASLVVLVFDCEGKLQKSLGSAAGHQKDRHGERQHRNDADGEHDIEMLVPGKFDKHASVFEGHATHNGRIFVRPGLKIHRSIGQKMLPVRRIALLAADGA